MMGDTALLRDLVTVLAIIVVGAVIVGAIVLFRKRSTASSATETVVVSVEPKPLPPRRSLERPERVFEVFPSFGQTGSSAWLVLVPGVGMIGPCKNKQHAERFVNATRDIQKKFAIEIDIDGAPTGCRVRMDLSSPPFYVWEFTGGRTGPLFGVQGPGGWEIPFTNSKDVAQVSAASLKLDYDNNQNGPRPGSEWEV